MIAVNVRCLDDVDIAALTPTPFDDAACSVSYRAQ